jgi:hypothetical protein
MLRMMHKSPCPVCGQSGLIMGVEYRGTAEDYDGVSEWRCAGCGTRWGRWSGKILTGDEIERRYGGIRIAKP